MSDERPITPRADHAPGTRPETPTAEDGRPKFRKTRYGAEFDPSIDLRENWKAAYPLCEAWWLLCDEEQREEYRNSGDNEAKSAFLEKMIKAEVLDLVFYDKLVALGFLVSPLLENEPSEIPSTFFRHEYRQVDWEASVVEGPGRRYEQVALCRAAQPADANSAADANPDGAIAASSPSSSGTKRGRTPDTRFFEAATRVLMREQADFLEWMQGKQVQEICDIAARDNPGRYRNAARPGRSTVSRFVQKHRKSNWSAFRNPENPENP
jgi:hypothetical protein